MMMKMNNYKFLLLAFGLASLAAATHQRHRIGASVEYWFYDIDGSEYRTTGTIESYRDGVYVIRSQFSTDNVMEHDIITQPPKVTSRPVSKPAAKEDSMEQRKMIQKEFWSKLSAGDLVTYTGKVHDEDRQEQARPHRVNIKAVYPDLDEFHIEFKSGHVKAVPFAFVGPDSPLPPKAPLDNDPTAEDKRKAERKNEKVRKSEEKYIVRSQAAKAKRERLELTNTGSKTGPSNGRTCKASKRKVRAQAQSRKSSGTVTSNSTNVAQKKHEMLATKPREQANCIAERSNNQEPRPRGRRIYQDPNNQGRLTTQSVSQSPRNSIHQDPTCNSLVAATHQRYREGIVIEYWYREHAEPIKSTGTIRSYLGNHEYMVECDDQHAEDDKVKESDIIKCISRGYSTLAAVVKNGLPAREAWKQDVRRKKRKAERVANDHKIIDFNKPAAIKKTPPSVHKCNSCNKSLKGHKFQTCRGCGNYICRSWHRNRCVTTRKFFNDGKKYKVCKKCAQKYDAAKKNPRVVSRRRRLPATGFQKLCEELVELNVLTLH